jgi:hypothetical protein
MVPEDGGSPAAQGGGGFNQGAGGFDYDAQPLAYGPTPGQIRCGNKFCNSDTENCCSGMAGSGNGSGFENCVAGFCPYRRECDETADCVGNEVCCYELAGPGDLSASCVPPSQCPVGNGLWIACSAQADCDKMNAPPCVAQQCLGSTVQTCGPITRVYCK